MSVNLLRLRRFTNISRSYKGLHTSSKPFPILDDTLNAENLHLIGNKEKSDEILAKLKEINRICMEGGKFI